MKKVIIAGLLGFMAFSHVTANASDRPNHFQGKEITSQAQALTVFKEANIKLAEVLKTDLNPTSMTTIHELTYTLENALALIPAADDEIKEVLEEVHLGSEMMDAERVRDNGEYYLQLAKKIK